MTAPAPSNSLFHEIIEPVITWGLVILGWGVVRYQSKKDEDRRDLRKTIDSLTVDIHALEGLCWDYYAQDAGSEAATKLNVTVKREKDKISYRINTLKEGYLKKKRFQDLTKMVDFANAITGGEFEQKDRKALPLTNALFLRISLAANELVKMLEIEFHNVR